MKVLVIAEKDSVGRQLAQAVLADVSPASDHVTGTVDGNLVLVTWANGHALELCPPEAYNPAWGGSWREDVLPIAPPLDGFRYEPKNRTWLEKVRDWMARSGEVVNACDAAREGELIFHEIFTYCAPNRNLDVTRMWITSTTAPGLRAAWDGRDLGTLKTYQYLRESALARQHADWMWGMTMTRKITCVFGRKYPRENGQSVWHVGRVQTPLLQMIHERTHRIDTYQEDEFFRLQADFQVSGGTFRAKVVAFPEMRYGNVDTHFRSWADAGAMKRELDLNLHSKWSVQDRKEPGEAGAPAPFDLTELQIAANLCRDLRFTAKQTLDLAQTLYQHEGAITYPRTDSTYFPEAMQPEVERVRKTLWENWAVKYYDKLDDVPLPPLSGEWFDDSKVRDHHAIMPTGVIPDPLDGDGRVRNEYLLWQLITMRFLHAWFPPAVVLKASRVLLKPFSDDPTKFYRAFLECAPVVSPGWMQVEELTFNTRGRGVTLARLRKEKIFPDHDGTGASLHNTWIDSGRTSRPDYYSDAMLLADMASAGLGTPATRAPAIEELIRRRYVMRLDNATRSMRTEPDGARLLSFLDDCNAQRLHDVALTASWETQLEQMTKKVADKPTRPAFLTSITEQMKEIIAGIDGRKDAPDLVFCPSTGNRVELSPDGKRWIFFGKFKTAHCFLSLRGREMTAANYRDIFIAGARGGGPFTFKSARTQNDYEAWVVYLPKKSGYAQWEIRLKKRGKKTTSLEMAPAGAGAGG